MLLIIIYKCVSHLTHNRIRVYVCMCLYSCWMLALVCMLSIGTIHAREYESIERYIRSFNVLMSDFDLRHSHTSTSVNGYAVLYTDVKSLSTEKQFDWNRTKIIFVKMANVFQDMMKKSKNQPTSEPSAPGGRPMHAHWDGLEKIKVNGKVTAKCLNCSKTFANTAQTRMTVHR